MSRARCHICTDDIVCEYLFPACCGKQAVYHKHCLSNWRKYSRKCPSCNNGNYQLKKAQITLNLIQRLESQSTENPDVIVID